MPASNGKQFTFDEDQLIYTCFQMQRCPADTCSGLQGFYSFAGGTSSGFSALIPKRLPTIMIMERT